jgi:hypothetical protein
MSRSTPTSAIVCVQLLLGFSNIVFAGTDEPLALVAALSNTHSAKRAEAAEGLRRILTIDPSVRTNDHGQDYWQKRIAAVKPGMKHSEVVTLLPHCDDANCGDATIYSGDSHISSLLDGDRTVPKS